MFITIIHANICMNIHKRYVVCIDQHWAQLGIDFRSPRPQLNTNWSFSDFRTSNRYFICYFVSYVCTVREKTKQIKTNNKSTHWWRLKRRWQSIHAYKKNCVRRSLSQKETRTSENEREKKTKLKTYPNWTWLRLNACTNLWIFIELYTRSMIYISIEAYNKRKTHIHTKRNEWGKK